MAEPPPKNQTKIKFDKKTNSDKLTKTTKGKTIPCKKGGKAVFGKTNIIVSLTDQ